jgi:hypothetical protein
MFTKERMSNLSVAGDMLQDVVKRPPAETLLAAVESDSFCSSNPFATTFLDFYIGPTRCTSNSSIPRKRRTMYKNVAANRPFLCVENAK